MITRTIEGKDRRRENDRGDVHWKLVENCPGRADQTLLERWFQNIRSYGVRQTSLAA